MAIDVLLLQHIIQKPKYELMDQTQLFGLESNLDIITNSREAKIGNN